MWRWQSIQEFQYPVIEYLSALKNVPLFIGLESVVAGHEHTSMSVITGQVPSRRSTRVTLPTHAPATRPLGNATALAQWEYCFDRGDTDTSRGGGQRLGLLGPRQPQRGRSELERRGRQADARRRRRHRRRAAT